MTKLNLSDKACAVIEWMVSDDLSEDLEMNVAFNKNPVLSAYSIKIISRKIAQIYKFAHAVNNHPCSDVHGDWREELNEAYRKLVKSKRIRGITVRDSKAVGLLTRKGENETSSL